MEERHSYTLKTKAGAWLPKRFRVEQEAVNSVVQAVGRRVLVEITWPCKEKWWPGLKKHCRGWVRLLPCLWDGA